MSNVRDAIDIVASSYRMVNSKPPTRLYLGRVEIKEVLDWSYQLNNDVDINHIEGEKRPKYAGMEVFQVNADSHLACS